jgi:transposase-like protein
MVYQWPNHLREATRRVLVDSKIVTRESADVEDGHRPGTKAVESAEICELKRRNRLLEQENEILRRAAAYLSQANLPGQ